MTMKYWIEAIDNQIIVYKRKVLIGKGNISHKQAIEKAEKELKFFHLHKIPDSAEKISNFFLFLTFLFQKFVFL